MTKREEWDRMIECVENESVSKEEILRFLKAHKPKPAERVKIVPCICGSKYIAAWWDTITRCWFYRCSDCGKQSEEARAVVQAKRNWNKMINKEKENETSI